jgi:hypothetical protein
VWLFELSLQLRVVALVGHYPTNKLIRRETLLYRRSFPEPTMRSTRNIRY